MKVTLKDFGDRKRIMADDKPIDFLAFKSFRPTKNNVSDFYKAGVRIFHVYCSGLRSAIKMPYSLYGECWIGDHQYRFKNIDDQIDFFLENAPDALLFINIHLDVREWWQEENPGRPNSFYNLSQIAGDEKWRSDTKDYLRALIRHVEEKYNKNVLCYWLLGGYTTEWFSHDDYEESHPIKLEAYRKYMGDDKIVIPSKERLERAKSEIFLDPIADKDIIDYRRFHSELITDTILYFAKEACEEIDHSKLIGVSSGYVMELVSGTVWDFGQLGFDRLNESEYIDIIGTPSSYKLRSYDDCGGYMLLTDSVMKNNKIYISSFDNQTYISRKSFDNPRRLCNDSDTVEAYKRLTGGYYQRNDDLKTFDQTLHAMRREMMHRLTKRSGTWWFDMLEGWYYDDALMDAVESLVNVSRRFNEIPSVSASEIAVFVSGESLYRANKFSAISDDLLVNQRSALGHIGAPYDLYSINDLEKIDVDKYKLYIFPNEYYLSDTERRLIEERVKGGGRSLLFVGAPDYAGESDLSLDRVSDILEMKVGILSTPEAKIGAFGSSYGYAEAKNPTLYVESDNAVTLGRFFESRKTALARCDKDGYSVYFSSLGRISAEVLSAIAKESGVHLYSEENVPVFVNSIFVGVYNPKAEFTTVILPEDGEFTDIFTGKSYKSENCRITLPTGENPAQMLYRSQAL